MFCSLHKYIFQMTHYADFVHEKSVRMWISKYVYQIKEQEKKREKKKTRKITWIFFFFCSLFISWFEWAKKTTFGSAHTRLTIQLTGIIAPPIHTHSKYFLKSNSFMVLMDIFMRYTYGLFWISILVKLNFPIQQFDSVRWIEIAL